MEKIVLKKNPLFDREFLNNLFSFHHREIYAKIILLTMKEEPLEQIEGKITDGNITVDGKSAVRRTCNLTMIAENVNINEFYWGLKNKFKLEIGIKNTINSNYPDIIWFKQGLFVITQFNTTQTTNKWTIKIQGKDKMCLLNGDLSGQLPPTDFAVEEYRDLETGEITLTKIPIKTIIIKLLQEFALEMPQNIIINDVDEAGYDLLEYRGETPFYLFKNILSEEIDNMSPNNELECYYQLKESLTQEEYDMIPKKYDFLKSIYIRDNYNIYHFNKALANENKDYKSRIKDSNWFKGTVADIFNIIYDDLLDDIEFEGNQLSTKIRFAKGDSLTEDIYSIIKIEYGDIPGYRATELVFAGELKSNAGETITSILDKIKNKFTNFEYYYNIDGKFVFQKKKEYLLTPWNSVENENNSLYTDAGINNSQTLFTFTDGQLITSFQNTPKIQNLKNDYLVHGNRDNMALRMRYAIDNKPTQYTPIRVLKEKIVTITRRSFDAKIVDEQIEYKYYDAPEMEPYNPDGLISTDSSYQIIEFLDKKINNLKTPKITFSVTEFKKIENILSVDLIGAENYSWCMSLFSARDDKNLRTWLGTLEDLKKIITILNDANIYYETPVQMSIIPTDDGYEVWTIVYPYFAKYPYSTSHVILVKDDKKKTESIIYKSKIDDGDNVIHYKVDWRELIYQMGLDYRKLNTTNNYYYYLTAQNNFISYNKTGYEQYYIDLISNWRDLYNPNPKINFDSSIKFNEIKKQSLLLDDDQNNDDFDTIYIQNGYSLIKKDADKDKLNYNNVYTFSHPIGSNINSIYPFYKSNSHYLDKNNKNYYLEDETTKKVKNIVNKTDDEGNVIEYVVYDTLKNVSPERIYIKNDIDFTTTRYSETKIELTRETYKPYTYFIETGDYSTVILPSNFDFPNALRLGERYFERDNNFYILTKDIHPIQGKIYYRINYRISKTYNPSYVYFQLDKIRYYAGEDFNSSLFNASNNSVGTDFKAYNYPSVINSDSQYEQNASSDYIIYAKANFEEKLKNNEITGTDSKKNSSFYIQDSNYVKLSNTDPLWDLYYRSNLYSFAYKTSDILNELEELVKNILNYELKTVNYIDAFNNIIKKYFLSLNEYNYFEINDFVLEIIQKLYETYYKGIKKIGNKSKNDFSENIDSFSCLYYIYSTLLEEYNNIKDIKNQNSNSSIEALFHINNLINSLNICIQKTLRNIELNYNQVSFILKDDSLNKMIFPEEDTVINGKYKSDIILRLRDQLNMHIATLTELNQLYINGQAQKTKNALMEIVDYINGNFPNILTDKGDYEDNIFENNDEFKNKENAKKINELYEQVIKDIKDNVFKWIEELDKQQDEINNFIIYNFIWTPDLEFTDNNEEVKYFKDMSEKEQEKLIGIKKESHSLYTSLIFLKELKNIFIKEDNGVYKNDLAAIINLLTYNHNNITYKVFLQLQNDLLLADENNQPIKSVLEDFENSTKDFQEYIILEDVNNFNQINSNKIYYLPINYNKGYYNYNREKQSGNYWYKDISENPQLLTFWFDFLEPISAEMSRYSVPAIGLRSKVVNDKDVKSIHYKDIPAVIFNNFNSNVNNNLSGYTNINLTQGFANLFAISSKGKTAKERIEELLLNYSYCSESVNLSIIPIYNLEPNNKIYIRDEKCNIEGEYLINKITIPLGFKKMMTVTATKSISDII